MQATKDTEPKPITSSNSYGIMEKGAGLWAQEVWIPRALKTYASCNSKLVRTKQVVN
jgi:hypothetical protein